MIVTKIALLRVTILSKMLCPGLPASCHGFLGYQESAAADSSQ
jgi:hypothetical protein